MDASPGKVNNYVVVSKIPAPVGGFKRSASVRVRGEKANLYPVSDIPFPSILEKEEFTMKKTPRRRHLSLNLSRSLSQANALDRNKDDDLDSVDSSFSNASWFSSRSGCEHAHFAKNGTTYSGHLHKYIVHCQTVQTDPDVYLTPTQRANRNIKRLKTLLQLAKEKLREKEEEIFKLTKEVVELKVFKASVNSQFSEASSPSELKDISSGKEENSVIDCGPNNQVMGSPDGSHKAKDFSCDTYNDFSPMKNSFYFEDNNDELLKMSPISPHHCYGEKLSATPDFLVSSLADSGNFDDLASSISLHSKDSVGFAMTPDFRPSPSQKPSDEGDEVKCGEEEKLRLSNMYECKLRERKLEYELELKRVVEEQEESNVKMMREFESKLKEEENKFEERWMNLLRTSEEEKKAIVDRFEAKLSEERERYLADLAASQERRASESVSGEAYAKTVEEEKTIYESSLERIKAKFETEKLLIERNFDDALKQERKKFEESIVDIKQISEARISELLTAINDLENRHKEMEPKYETLLRDKSELEGENERLKEALEQQEERHKNTYLKLYMKGQEAAKLEHEDKVAEFATKGQHEAIVPELLVQLKVTEAELENLKDKEYRAFHTDEQGVCLLSSKEAISLWMLAARKAMYKRLAEAQSQSTKKDVREENNAEATLQFLKSAVYYFLTDRENHLGHLRAIESILGFSAAEKSNIEKNYAW